MPWTLIPLRVEHAAAAAAIHAEGQPGTFLSRLGLPFLSALYAQMASSPLCFGFVATQEGGEIIGVVVGTTDTAAVFKEMLLKRGYKLVWPIVRALWRDPALLGPIMRTAFYPGQVESAGQAKGAMGELFSIGTAAGHRGQGIGRALFQALAKEMRRRGMAGMGLVVEADNATARRFYEYNGMHPERSLLLYGRRMIWYELTLSAI
ncbi:MAG: GNAT family N-acetyltransferase [Chloroflexi bacterium]|nr:GNAT family N-acetyltransferase [Chloroflexota bacterium]